MIKAETEPKITVDLWAKEKGITVPLAPVVVRFYSPPHPSKISSETEWEAVMHPFYGLTTWLTSKLGKAEGYQGFEMVSVIGMDGNHSDLGFAIPKESGCPFCFRWEGEPHNPSTTQVSGIETKTFPPNPEGRDEGLFVFEMHHPYISDLIPQERYVLVHRRDGDVSRLIKDHVARESLMSGSGHRAKVSRMAVGWQQKLPFEYLLGRNQPGWHNLMGREKLRE